MINSTNTNANNLNEFYEARREPFEQNDSIPNQEESPQDREERVATISNETETFEEKAQRIQERRLPEFIRKIFRNADLISPISLEPFYEPVLLNCSSPTLKHAFNMQELRRLNDKNCPLCRQDFSRETLSVERTISESIQEIWNAYRDVIGFSYEDYIACCRPYMRNRTERDPNDKARVLSEAAAYGDISTVLKDVFGIRYLHGSRWGDYLFVPYYADLNVPQALIIAIQYNQISIVKELLVEAALHGDLATVQEIFNRFGETHFAELNVANALMIGSVRCCLPIIQEIFNRFSETHFRELAVNNAIDRTSYCILRDISYMAWELNHSGDPDYCQLVESKIERKLTEMHLTLRYLRKAKLRHFFTFLCS